MASLEPLNEGLTVFERYLLEAPLGRARTGHSWGARDQRLDMTVALKVFDNHPKPSVLEQGVREHVDVTHPNLVRLFEFVGDAERCAVVTEYVEGRSLGTLLRNRLNGCFEMQEIRKWTEQLLSALSAIHKKGKVHGDLNLENLLVNERNDLKVLDLGLREGRLQSRSGELAFTVPTCTSPQALGGSSVQPTDDLYAAAACVFELLTGRPLFSGGNVPMQIESKIPPLVNARRAELGVGGEPVPEEWQSWINACLAKERRDRPQNADALIEIVRRSAGATTKFDSPPPAPEPPAPAQVAAPTAYFTTPHGMTVPVMMAPHPHPSPWGKIAVLGILVAAGCGFYFGSWKPSREELKKMDLDFQKLRQLQNKSPDEIGALKELQSVIEDFVTRYAGVDIPYSDKDDNLRAQADQRLDTCVAKIRELERALAAELQKERDAKQAALKAASAKANELSTATVSAKTKVAKWQTLLDDFGDWDNPDSLDDNKMIAEARASVEKFKAEQQRETEQMQRYGQQLELAIDSAITIRSNKALTAGMKWKSFLELPKLPSKAPGEQEQDFSKLEQSLEELRKELDEAARKETPAEPLTLDGLFANSSFKKLSATAKGDMIRGAQNVLKADGLLLMDQPDGQPGKATHQSIAEFQLKNGLVANGELNDLTLWFMGFEGPPPASVSAEAAKTSKPTQTNKKPRIPKCPEKSIYDGFVGRTRLGKDQLFNRVNKEEYAKHLRYKAWQDKYGDLEEE